MTNDGGDVLLAVVALLAGTALLGSYTTFSTWLLEIARLGEGHHKWTATGNIVLGVSIGLTFRVQLAREPARHA